MKRTIVAFVFCFATLLCANEFAHTQAGPAWPQWGRTPQHTGSIPIAGQDPNTQLADITFDPFVNEEKAETYGELLDHFQAPLIDASNVLLEMKTGKYISCDPPGSGQPYPCGPDAWNLEVWNERAFHWVNRKLVKLWNFKTDWKPEPNSGAGGGGTGLYGWEPVFHAVLSGNYVFVPGFSGSLYKVNKANGKPVAHFRPFRTDPNAYVSGPLTADSSGNIYYNVVVVDGTNPWTADVHASYLVKVPPKGAVTKVSYKKLVSGSPDCGDPAYYGSQRPGINIAPAISADGKTVYTLSRAHFYPEYACLDAVQSDLTPIWHSSLQLSTLIGDISDLSSASPVVTPDGSILYGSTSDQTSRGNMLKFDSAGNFLASYDFGWDDTPAVYAHDGTYSVITKDNHYETGGPYYITQLSSDLVPEWQYESVDNYEWCVNAPAVDDTGNVYADSEDGNLFVIEQGGTLKGKVFLQEAIGAAYTPVSLGRDGRIYTENNGDMFTVGR